MEREDFFDSLKFVLVFIVVLVHCDGSNKLDNYKLNTLIYAGSFVIPLFIFISGYFSKNLTWKKIKMTFISIMLTYIVFQLIYSSHIIITGQFSILNFFTQPLIGLWYLLCLIICRFVIYFTDRFKIPVILILIADLVIVVFGGFILKEIPFYKVFVFFPFFIMGYCCTPKIIKKIREYNKLHSIIIILILYCFMFTIDTTYIHRAILGHQFNIDYPSNFNAITHKLLMYPVITFISILVLNIVPDTFHKLGEKSLDIFLLHPFFVPFYIDISRRIDSHIPLWFDFIVAVLITIICIKISDLKFFKILVNPILLFLKKR